MTSPWNTKDAWCDDIGNCIDLGYSLALFSFSISCLSVLKNSLDSFQVSKDRVGLAALVVPTTLFKIGAYTLNYVFLGDFFVIVLAAAMVVNFLVTQSGWKEENSGINLTTTSAASVFSTTVLPQQLEDKEATLIFGTPSKVNTGP